MKQTNKHIYDSFQEELITLLDKYYKDFSREATIRGMIARVKDGKYIGKLPYGYANQGTNKVVREFVSGDVVEKVFDMYSSGKSIADIEEYLSEKYPFEEVSMVEIYQVLKNPFYCGFIRVQGELFPHKYLKLVTQEKFDKVQELLKANKAIV